jgi:hypothetical protein
MMRFLQSMLNSVNIGSIHLSLHIANTLAKMSNPNVIPMLPLANILEGPATGGIPCDDYFVQLTSNGLAAFLSTLMDIGGIIGLVCIVLGGLLRIAALTTQKKEDKDDRMFLAKFAFICAIIFLIPTLIFFILLILLPHWYGLGNKTCH